MSRKIGISVLCFGIKSLLQGPGNTYRKALVDAGADGLQMLPIWFWSNESISCLKPSRIISYEGAWNKGSIIESFTNKDRLKRDNYLSWVYDLVLFMGICNIPKLKMNFFKKHFPDAIAIDTQEGGVVETQPDGEATWLNTNSDLTVDLFHILERYEGNTDTSLQVIDIIAERAVCIHLQWRERDFTTGMLEDFMEGKGYLRDGLDILMKKSKKNAPVIIEISEGDLLKKGFSMSQVVDTVKTIDKS